MVFGPRFTSVSMRSMTFDCLRAPSEAFADPPNRLGSYMSVGVVNWLTGGYCGACRDGRSVCSRGGENNPNPSVLNELLV